MKSTDAFKHAAKMFAAIQAAMALPTHAAIVAAMGQIGEYKSRGHGGKHRVMQRLGGVGADIAGAARDQHGGG